MASKIIVFGLFAGLLNYSHGLTNVTTCQSASCTRLATKITSSMNRQLSPCDDFYEYSCYNYKSKTGAVITDPTKGIEIKLNKELLGILSQSKNSKEPLAVHKAKDVFNACMNEKQRDKQGNFGLLNTIREFGGWPILEPKSDDQGMSSGGWEHITGKLRRLGYSLLVKVNVNVDQRNCDRHVVVLDSIDSKNPIPGPENFFAYLGVTAAYSSFIQGVVELLGYNVTDQCKEDIKDMLRFQIKLDKIITPNHASKDAEFALMSLNTLNAFTNGKVDWTLLLNTIFKDIKNFGPEDKLAILDKNYIHEIADLLSVTPLRVVQNYLIWRVIKDVAEDGDSDMVALLTRVQQKGAVQKSETCVNEVKGFMTYAVTNLYVKAFNSSDLLPKVGQVLFNVKNSFEDVIKSNVWMDQPTKRQAIDKLRIMAIKIGYPSWILDAAQLNDYYRDVNITQHNHFSNILELSFFYTKQELKLITKVTDRVSWAISPLTANAFYHRTLNTIYMPLPMLRPPFFHADWPMAALFGSIGAVAGHEMTHGLEDGSSLYSIDSMFEKWWTETSTKRYTSAANCVEAQYNKFCSSEPEGAIAVEQICVNGERTLRENIADIGGVKAAFSAFRDWMTTHVEETTLPNMHNNLTLTQLFFTSNAQMWCSSYDPVSFRQQLLTSTNSPSKFRLLGSIAGLQEFGKAFNCTIPQEIVTSQNPQHCHVW